MPDRTTTIGRFRFVRDPESVFVIICSRLIIILNARRTLLSLNGAAVVSM